jgi:hypothetical protein
METSLSPDSCLRMSKKSYVEAQLPHQELRRQFGAFGGVFRLWSSGRARLRGVADTIFLRRFLVPQLHLLDSLAETPTKLETVVDEGQKSNSLELVFLHCQFGSWRFTVESD